MIRLVIVHGDDQKREILTNTFATDKKFRVLTAFKSSQEALSYIENNEVSVVLTSDVIEDMTGYEFITKLMKKRPTATLLLVEQDGSLEIDFPQALDYSIVDTFHAKYSSNDVLYKSRMFIKTSILSKLNLAKFLTQIEQINHYSPSTSLKLDANNKIINLDGKPQLTPERLVPKSIEKSGVVTKTASFKAKPLKKHLKSYDKIVIMGASTGGPRMLVYLVSQLPVRFPPVLIIQHMPEGFVNQFAARMNTNSRINVKKAENGDLVLPGNVYIAPGGYHMELMKRGKKVYIRLTDGPKVNFVKPAMDVTLFSAARIYEDKVVGVILTGMGSDGREGARVIKKVGGKIVCLNESDSVIYGMNKSVVEAGLADSVVGMDAIIKEIAYHLS